MTDFATFPTDTLFVTQYYRPEWIGSGPYCGDMAEWLTAHNLDVHVLTGRPHYPYDAIFASYRSGDRDREILDGVAITRVPNRIVAGGGAAKRLATDAHFLFCSLLELFRGRVRRRSLVVSLCPSIFSVLLGIALTRRGGRHVAIVHDIESGLAEGLGIVGGGIALRGLRSLERFSLNRTDMIFALSESMRIRLRALGVTTPIHILPIWIDTDAIYPAESTKKPGAGRSPTIVYSGNFGRKQALKQILDCAGLLKSKGPTLRITLRGEGREARALMEMVRTRGFDNIEFEPLAPPEAFNDALAEGDIHLVPQNPEAADYALPSKIFAIMSAGRPFIATAQAGSPLWQLREETGAFLCVPPNDPAALSNAILRLADDEALRNDLGAHGRAYVLRHHAKPKILRDFLNTVRDGR